MLLLVIRHSHISLAEGRHADLGGQSSGVPAREGVVETCPESVYLSDGPPWWATTTHCAPGALFELILEQESSKTRRKTQNTIWTFADDQQGLDYWNKPVLYGGRLIVPVPQLRLSHQTRLVLELQRWKWIQLKGGCLSKYRQNNPVEAK